MYFNTLERLHTSLESTCFNRSFSWTGGNSKSWIKKLTKTCFLSMSKRFKHNKSIWHRRITQYEEENVLNIVYFIILLKHVLPNCLIIVLKYMSCDIRSYWNIRLSDFKCRWIDKLKTSACFNYLFNLYSHNTVFLCFISQWRHVIRICVVNADLITGQEIRTVYKV